MSDEDNDADIWFVGVNTGYNNNENEVEELYVIERNVTETNFEDDGLNGLTGDEQYDTNGMLLDIDARTPQNRTTIITNTTNITTSNRNNRQKR